MDKLKHRINSFDMFLILFLGFITNGFTQEIKDYLPKPKKGNIYVVAHRGVHNGIPENTLAAYQKAIDLRCDFVEIDIRKTKDRMFLLQKMAIQFLLK